MLFFLNDYGGWSEVIEVSVVVLMIVTVVLLVPFNDGDKGMKPIPAV